MATLQEVGEALRNAHEAGDEQAARALAAEYERLAQTTAPGVREAVAPAGAAGAPARNPGESELPDLGTPKRLLTKGIPQVGASLAKTLGSLLLLPVEAGRAGARGIGMDQGEPGELTRRMQGKIDQFIPPPETKAGKLGVGGASAAIEAAVTPGSFMRNLAAQLGARVGVEVGGKVGQEKAGDNGRIIGGVIGGVVGGAPAGISGRPSTYNEMLAEAVRGLKPGDFAAAERLSKEAARHGITLTPEQLFDKQTGMDTLVNQTIASGKGSGRLQAQVLDQPGQLEAAARQGANRLGTNPGTAPATRDLREAAEGVLADAGKTRETVGKLFRSSEPLPGSVIDDLDANLAILAAEYKGSRETVAKIEDLRARLGAVTEKGKFPFGTNTRVQPGSGAQKWRTVQEPNELEVTLGANPGDLDLVAKSVEATLKDLGLGNPAMERLMTGRVGGAVGSIKKILDEHIPTRTQGRELYGSMKDRQSDMSEDLLGRIAGYRGVQDGRPDNLNLIPSTLGRKDKQDSEIAALASALRERAARQAGTAPEASAQATRALPQAARVLWDKALDTAFNPGATGRPAGTAGASFASSMVGREGSNQAGNFNQLMQGVGQAVGAEPKSFAAGMEQLLRVMQASGRNRSGALAASPGAINQGQSMGADALRASATGTVSPAWGGVTAARGLANRLSVAAHARQYAKLEEILSDPNAVQLIQQLGKTPVMSSRAGAIANILLGATSEPILTEGN